MGVDDARVLRPRVDNTASGAALEQGRDDASTTAAPGERREGHARTCAAMSVGIAGRRTPNSDRPPSHMPARFSIRGQRGRGKFSNVGAPAVAPSCCALFHRVISLRRISCAQLGAALSGRPGCPSACRRRGRLCRVVPTDRSSHHSRDRRYSGRVGRRGGPARTPVPCGWRAPRPHRRASWLVQRECSCAYGRMRNRSLRVLSFALSQPGLGS